MVIISVICNVFIVDIVRSTYKSIVAGIITTLNKVCSSIFQQTEIVKYVVPCVNNINRIAGVFTGKVIKNISVEAVNHVSTLNKFNAHGIRFGRTRRYPTAMESILIYPWGAIVAAL